MKTTIALIGLMGTGKSTVGRLLAARLDRPFLDNDVLLTERFGASAADLGERVGLEELHRMEAQVLTDQLAWPEPSVINAAASTVDDPVLRTRLHGEAFVVWLRAAPDVLAARVAAGPQRPTLGSAPVPTAADIEALADKRHAAFTEVADLVVDTTSEPPDASVNRILAAWAPEGDGELRG